MKTSYNFSRLTCVYVSAWKYMNICVQKYKSVLSQKPERVFVSSELKL